MPWFFFQFILLKCVDLQCFVGFCCTRKWFSYILMNICVVVQSLGCVWLFATSWTTARQALLSFSISLARWNSCPLNRWCHPALSSSVVLYSWLQSFQTSGSFPVSRLFVSGGQSIGVSASISVLPMSIQDWLPLGLTGLILPTLKSLLRQLQFKSISSSALSLLLTSVHDYWRNHSFD